MTNPMINQIEAWKQASAEARNVPDDPVHNHPTVQALLKDVLVHRVAFAVVAVLLLLTTAALVFHQVEMGHDEDAISHTLRTE